MNEEWAKLSEEKSQVNFEVALKKNWEGTDASTGQKISGPVYIIAAASVQVNRNPSEKYFRVIVY